MFDFLFASANLPFTVALGLMAGIGILEGVATMLGLGMSGAIDSLLPDTDIDIESPHPHLDGTDVIDAHAQDIGGLFSRLLSWLHIGRVPILMLFIVFLCAFGSIGLVLQALAANVSGYLLPGFIAAVPAFIGAVATVRVTGSLLIRIMPKDETSAVSETTFIGRVAVITIGTARKGNPAQAKLHDQFGQTHYVMVEPDDADVAFATGQDVLIVKRAGHIFTAIANTSESLVDTSQ